jgi:hypothetical protein
MKVFPSCGMGWLPMADEMVIVMSRCVYELIRVAPATKADQGAVNQASASASAMQKPGNVLFDLDLTGDQDATAVSIVGAVTPASLSLSSMPTMIEA